MSTEHATPARTIVVTGSSRGIGLHLATHFLDLGYRVVGISRSPTPIDHVSFRHITADLGDLGQIAAVADALAGEPIAGLINNAGANGPIGAYEAAPMDSWVQTFHVNLFGPAALTQACIPALRENHGFIVFLSGGGSAFPRPNFSSYGISKTAVVRLSEVLALELAPEVLVYCIAPGPNPTQLLQEAIDGGEHVPDGDMVDFGYTQRLCTFLAQNRDPRYSGKFIHVKDNYTEWGDRELAGDGYTLRRIKVT
jgi:NAD(P)-dependent dehydrogenase (short-subunit alcohol dehydrogenase family)